MPIVYGVIAIFIGYQMIQGNFYIFGLYLGTPGWILVAAGAWMIWKWLKNSNTKAPANSDWDNLTASSQYKHFYKGTGVAVDTNARKIHLLSDSTSKTYPFSEVREWSYSLLTGGTVIGGNTLAAGVHNIRQMKENKANSGLFISVADIDQPEWRVAFPHSHGNNKKNELELKRWMEIFQQKINENR